MSTRHHRKALFPVIDGYVDHDCQYLQIVHFKNASEVKEE